MKNRRLVKYAALLAAAAIALLLAAGCGGGGDGKKTQEVTSPWDGAIEGIATEPFDGETDIDLDSWIHVFWPDVGFPPPGEFTVQLQKEEFARDWGGVHTVFRSEFSDPGLGDWWFEPSSFFSRNTWYRIVVRDVETLDQYIAEFLTTSLAASAESAPGHTQPTPKTSKKYRPAGAENAPPSGEEGAIEHRIKVGK